MAEWVEVSETEDEDLTYYADPATIRKSGNKVKMWSLYDYKTALDPGVLSAKEKVEYNCKERQRRQLFVSAYSENMGGGKTVLINNSRDEWEPVPPPDSVGEAVFKFACSFRPELPHTFPDETFS